MTSRRRNPDQIGLFGTVTTAPAPVPARQCPPPRGKKPGRAPANPLIAKEVLAEVNLGRFGLLDDTDRVMVFEDDDRVRAALDEDLVHHLISGGYIERCPARETVSAKHGAITRPILPLRLTKRGRDMLQRWSNLHPLPK
ncbi:hypothetical protein [Amycolatopsis sp. H20-H5]|uniref:hypothetical protein n=1 Tax=Amycolatopsis sp. H20-H5 TaxID=3046309 RepID=UPI002DB7F389|nr:hypothetical protein [Amycolatopsis sp. H20-H5]MEC3975941.1 hypothetical protein [Amycolatopsis sp. H20-H5]